MKIIKLSSDKRLLHKIFEVLNTIKIFKLNISFATKEKGELG
jgi:hypothetical protein